MLGKEGRQTEVVLANVLGDEGFEGVKTSVRAGIRLTEDGDNSSYSGETGEDVDVQCIETVREGVVIMRRGGVDHVECAVNMCVEMFL